MKAQRRTGDDLVALTEFRRGWRFGAEDSTGYCHGQSPRETRAWADGLRGK